MANRGRHAKKIDTVHWTGWTFSAAAVNAGTPVAVTVAAAQHLPETLMRIRGEWVAALDGAQTGGQGVSVSAGMILVPEGTGTTVLWAPSTDADAPWIWWDVMHLFYEEYIADVVVSQMVADGRRVIDSKAMRRIRNTELQFVVENLTIANSAAIRMAGSVRVLSGS